MTRKELSQVYYLKKELNMWEQELNNLIASSQIKAQSLDGMPFQNTGDVSDVVANIAIKIIEQTEVVDAARYNVERKIAEIDKYIASLDDSFLKQIINYRCCKCMSWDNVARMIGSGTSAESCRKYFDRKIPKN